jgi:ABC-type Fe3+-hydroxamate transport system substrate-binding protein
MVTRIVSLVPSLTDLVVLLGAGDRLVGVTTYCAHPTARRVGGSKFFDPEVVMKLDPDLVLANLEENHPDRLAPLQDAGLRIIETYPRTVADVRPMIVEVAAAVGGDARHFLADLDTALAETEQVRPVSTIPALTLIWRRPWMGVGPDTYVDDLLRTCGFVNVLAGSSDRYPKIDVLEQAPAIVLLPDEPYAFSDEDLPAVAKLVGDVPARLVDGQLLSWHGPRTAAGLREFSQLAAELAA